MKAKHECAPNQCSARHIVYIVYNVYTIVYIYIHCTWLGEHSCLAFIYLTNIYIYINEKYISIYSIYILYN